MRLFLCIRQTGRYTAIYLIKILQKKESFLKTVTEASTLMAGWKNKLGNYMNKYNEANDGMAFITDGKEEKTGIKNNKKKEITCFKSTKKGHYSNECD